MNRVHVDLGENSYDIFIQPGLLQEIPSLTRSLSLQGSIFIISDTRVASIYGELVLKQFQKVGKAHLLTVPEGESSKSISMADSLYTQLLQLGANRKDTIIALGGGVIGDLAGFVAATFMRGIPFIQIPTTVLAQVDSSVGGKVGINHPMGKNLIGAFYQPRLVIIDPDVLHSLDERQVRAGLAEVIKYAFISDPVLFQTLETHLESIIRLEEKTLVNAVLEKCCQIKAEVVRQDEKESGLRAILNFGHTLGHALEAVTGYRTLYHGEAVAHGMIMALELSKTCGLSNQEVSRGQNLVRRLEVAPLPENLDPAAILEAMARDKKRLKNVQNWILLTSIGNAVITNNISPKQTKTVLTDLRG
ncbi:3-dehydroquinate synthase [candidate division KSB1 bacterium]|nr:3-dehydroquinate synthase [candidate division KSB1 bacterium]